MGELPSVHADPTLLRVLVTNLLSNAFKFTSHAEAPKLEVGGYVQGGETVYYFEDNGIGFDMQDAGRLFGVFERLHGSTQYDGHGVGLAVVERIARRHGGTVRAEGVLGKGATFFVTFPARPSAA
jgi:light-regulated signal transduction histidine kinase (bacteriophytochrome)